MSTSESETSPLKVRKEVFLPPISDSEWDRGAESVGISASLLHTALRHVSDSASARDLKAPTPDAERLLAHVLAAINPEWRPDLAIAAVRDEVGPDGIVYPWRLLIWRQYKQMGVVFDVLGERP